MIEMSIALAVGFQESSQLTRMLSMTAFCRPRRQAKVVVPIFRLRWTLSVVLSSILFVWPARGASPPQFISAYIGGIGFTFVPVDIHSECIANICDIRQRYENVSFVIHYPGDLAYFGSGCKITTDGRVSLRFRAANNPILVHDKTIAFRLESRSCPGRTIELRYAAYDWHNPDLIEADIMQANISWFICIRGPSMSVLCDNDPAVDDKTNALFTRLLKQWVVSQSQTK